jgi:hypothetical protein
VRRSGATCTPSHRRLATTDSFCTSPTETGRACTISRVNDLAVTPLDDPAWNDLAGLISQGGDPKRCITWASAGVVVRRTLALAGEGT